MNFTANQTPFTLAYSWKCSKDTTVDLYDIIYICNNWKCSIMHYYVNLHNIKLFNLDKCAHSVKYSFCQNSKFLLPPLTWKSTNFTQLDKSYQSLQILTNRCRRNVYGHIWFNSNTFYKFENFLKGAGDLKMNNFVFHCDQKHKSKYFKICFTGR
jgi:hypothetical protein